MKNWILCLIPCLFVGCGSSAPSPLTSEENVFAHVVGLGDASGSEKMFQDAFVSGAAPQNRQDYGKYVYLVDGDAQIEGDEAIVPVKIIAGMVVAPQGKKQKTEAKSESIMTWKLKREGEEWKLKEAPLPG